MIAKKKKKITFMSNGVAEEGNEGLLRHPSILENVNVIMQCDKKEMNVIKNVAQAQSRMWL